MNDSMGVGRELPPALVARLTACLGERFSLSSGVRAHHGRDESHFPDQPPQAVAFVASTAEVVEVVRACAEYGVPLIPYGTGTSLEGHVLAPYGGVSVDVSQMNHVLEIDAEDMLAVVQPGVTRKQLNAALRGTGLFFPIDPGADASIGGMTATRASGTNAVRYGTMRENVLALEVVLADGRVLRTGTRAKKSSAGYDLTRLFVGSEGTLGIFTEITVRLHPLPEDSAVAVVRFPSMQAAVETVIRTIQSGVPIGRVEFLDEVSIHAINRYSKTDLAEAPTLFFEFQGSPRAIEEQVALVEELAREHGAEDFAWANRPEERSRLWEARHQAYFACINLRPGCRGITTDSCVPISKLAEAVLRARAAIDASGLIAPILGHVGDGNFHTVILIDPEDATELERAEALSVELVEIAQSLGGTCSGEHGVGMGKREFVAREAGEVGVAVMRAIKTAFDPRGILNPGKLVP